MGEGRAIRSSLLLQYRHIKKRSDRSAFWSQNMCLLPCGKKVVTLQRKLKTVRSETTTAQLHQRDRKQRSDENTANKVQKTDHETTHPESYITPGIDAGCQIGYDQDKNKCIHTSLIFRKDTKNFRYMQIYLRKNKKNLTF